jgi:hypothetical protein
MQIIVVVAEDEPAYEQLHEAIQAKYPADNYRISSSTWIVATGSPIGNVAKALGISEKGEIGGILLRISNYSGFASADIWDWLRTKSDAQSNG